MMTRQAPLPTRLDLTRQPQIYQIGESWARKYLQTFLNLSCSVLKEDQWLPAMTLAQAPWAWGLLRLPRGGDKFSCSMNTSLFSITLVVGLFNCPNRTVIIIYLTSHWLFAFLELIIENIYFISYSIVWSIYESFWYWNKISNCSSISLPLHRLVVKWSNDDHMTDRQTTDSLLYACSYGLMETLVHITYRFCSVELYIECTLYK